MVKLIILAVLILILYLMSKHKAFLGHGPTGGDYYNVNLKYTEKGLNAKSSAKARECLQILEDGYKEVSSGLCEASRSVYLTDIQDVRDTVAELEQEEWERKALKYLEDFAECWDLLNNRDLENFKDVEAFFWTKDRLIRSWQSYFAIDLSEYSTTIYPKRYLREFMGEDYDPCMESHDALEKRFSSQLEKMRPEKKRKNKLYGKIVDYVHSHTAVPRSELLKVSFPGFIPEEIRCCYKELVRQNRLVELKMGDRWFVSLSDKELSKAKHQKQIQEVTPEQFAEMVK